MRVLIEIVVKRTIGSEHMLTQIDVCGENVNNFFVSLRSHLISVTEDGDVMVVEEGQYCSHNGFIGVKKVCEMYILERLLHHVDNYQRILLFNSP